MLIVTDDAARRHRRGGRRRRRVALVAGADQLPPQAGRTDVSQDRFPSPFEVPTPEGAEGWEQLYNW